MTSHEAQDAPWGEASFAHDRNWFAHLPTNGWNGDEKKLYTDLKARAEADPEFDLFSEFMPTGRPKHDIGRYVMRHGISVPLIQSMSEWQHAIVTGTAMLRSEHYQDYSGQSGLYSSEVLRVRETYPLNEYNTSDEDYELDEASDEYILKRRYEGPVRAELDIGRIDMLTSYFGLQEQLGNAAVTGAIEALIRDGLQDGTVNPAYYMRLKHWDSEHARHASSAQAYRYKHLIEPDQVKASRWRYVPGVNISIFRDNVVEGKYYLGGREAHHHWEVTDGVDSPDVVAHDKTGYRGRNVSYDTREYTLPTSKIIALYEKIRTLSFFDHNQAPMMELQYADDGNLHFLQYLKTGLRLHDPGAFELPTGPNVVTSYDVRGATSPEGEKMRIYLDPRALTRRMHGQATFNDYNMSSGATNVEQIAALTCGATILNTMLSFKDNHWSSAPLYRAPIAIGTWNGEGEVEERFAETHKRRSRLEDNGRPTHVDYIDAIITSNGRAATIDSDWSVKTEALN